MMGSAGALVPWWAPQVRAVRPATGPGASLLAVGGGLDLCAFRACLLHLVSVALCVCCTLRLLRLAQTCLLHPASHSTTSSRVRCVCVTYKCVLCLHVCVVLCVCIRVHSCAFALLHAAPWAGGRMAHNILLQLQLLLLRCCCKVCKNTVHCLCALMRMCKRVPQLPMEHTKHALETARVGDHLHLRLRATGTHPRANTRAL